MKDLGVDIAYTFAEEKSGFSLGKDKRTSFSEAYKSVKSVIPESTKVRLPLLNVVDDGDSTQDSLGRAVAEVWGLKYGFLNSAVTTLVQQFAKVRRITFLRCGYANISRGWGLEGLMMLIADVVPGYGG